MARDDFTLLDLDGHEGRFPKPGKVCLRHLRDRLTSMKRLSHGRPRRASCDA